MLFDPSCLYGDPDFDLVIPRFEGGLHADFHTSYRGRIPIQNERSHENKMAAYKLFYNLIMWCHVDQKELKKETLSSLHDLRDLLRVLP